MLEVSHIRKSYTTGTFTQTALDDVSIAFRDNEFVAILGPSGSGKTTLLNIIGGLDHYDEGDLLVDGVSTKEYQDREWDAYRNNRIGFVFQSYNLIPHQTVLANVELALTLSGVSPSERRDRAMRELDRVGLAEHVHKKPSQLSGGQMQRVAIARALINDPEILLADEPTGALDSNTSVQIMDLLTEIADDRLVIMVTHNPDLAEQYATRIVNLADGVIVSDTDPFCPSAEQVNAASARPLTMTSMSFLTALSLSANNLMTKKGRTIMTAVAGSIGIIGIAVILALANGVNDYIARVEEDTLSVYPLTIESTAMDMSSLFVDDSESDSEDTGNDNGVGTAFADEAYAQTVSEEGSSDGDGGSDAADNGAIAERKTLTNMFSRVGTNDLVSLKEYFDANGGGINDYVNLIDYKYNIVPQIFASDTSTEVHQVNPDTSFTALGLGASNSGNSFLSMNMTTNIFNELMDNPRILESQYDIRAGRWPEAADELVLVLSRQGTISDLLLYDMGLRDHHQLENMVDAFAEGEKVETPVDELEFTNEDLMNVTFKLVHASDCYQYDETYGVWLDKTTETDYMRSLVDNGMTLKIVGIVQPDPAARSVALDSGLYYTHELTEAIVQHAAESDIVKSQLADSTVNVFSGRTFEDEANDSGGDFDLASAFSVNGDLLASAFTFNADALEVDLSSLDLSGIDLSNMQLPELDASMFEFDLGGLSADISLDQLSEAFPELTPETLQTVLGSVTVHFRPNGASMITQELSSIITDYINEHQGENVAAYVSSPEIRQRVASAIIGAIDTDDLQTQLATALAEQLGVEDPSQLGDEVTNRVIGIYRDKVAEALTTQIAGAMQSYLEQALTVAMMNMMTTLSNQLETGLSSAMQSIVTNMSNAMGIDEQAFMNAFSFNMTEEELSELMASMMTVERTSYDSNLRKLGYADFAKPASIELYPIDFNSKEEVKQILEDYNAMRRASGEDDKVISYSDLVGTLMSSVTEIIDMISYVLIAFVAISLVVSSIMIGVITYISVLERIKEIGILRSIGASKRDISHVFNAETIIEGLISGVLGIVVTVLLCFPINAVVEQMFSVQNVAILPWQAGIALIGISVLLTFIAGLVPSSSASRKDPVEALRSE